MAICTLATGWKGEVAVALQASWVICIVANYHADVGRLRGNVGLKRSSWHWRTACKATQQVKPEL